jgi:hypothetical protein
MSRWILPGGLGVSLVAALVLYLIYWQQGTRDQPSHHESVPIEFNDDNVVTRISTDSGVPVVGEPDRAEETAHPSPEYRQKIRSQVLPGLYTSNDIDALITGALIVRAEDQPYRREDFLTLALTLNPDDLLTNVLSALYCTDGIRREGIEAFCDSTDFTGRLARLTGDNGWTWLMLADVADQAATRRDLLAHAAKGMYYSDYSTELLAITMTSLLPFTESAESAKAQDDPLLLQGVNSVNAIVGQFSAAAHCMDEVGDPDTCTAIADQLSNSGSLAAVMQGHRIRELATGIPISTPPPRHPWWDQLTIELFEELLSKNPSFRDTVNRYQTRYVEMDAIKQAMIDYGYVDDDDIPREMIRPNDP